MWRPKAWLSLVFNNYGMGEDTLGNGNGQFGRSRIHTDDSIEVKYYDRPDRFLDKMAFSFTGDLGCEYGGKGTAVGAQGTDRHPQHELFSRYAHQPQADLCRVDAV